MQGGRDLPLSRRLWGLCSIALAWAFAAATVSPAAALDPRVEPFAEDIVKAVQARLLAKMPLRPKETTRTAVSLTVLTWGEQPVDKTCLSSIRSQFDKQLGQLVGVVGNAIAVAPASGEATITVIVGDTHQLLQRDSKEVPFEEWWRAAERRYPSADYRHYNPGFPHFAPTEFLEGLYSQPSDRLVHGRIFVHWAAITTYRGIQELCRYGFVERLVELPLLALTADLREDIYEMEQAFRNRIGSKDFIYEISADFRFLVNAALYCAELEVQTSTNVMLNDCARRLADLLHQTSL